MASCLPENIPHVVVVRDAVHLRPGLALVTVPHRLLDDEDQAGGRRGGDCHRHLLVSGLGGGLGPVVAGAHTGSWDNLVMV